MIPPKTLPSPFRRRLLAGALGLGLTVELLGYPAWSAAESTLAHKRLVVIICRGGLDGLSLSPPVGDRDYAGLRGPIGRASCRERVCLLV